MVWMMKKVLPPLNALRAFEAAGRSGSYVKAARELGVSPSAVSQQVRKIEAYFAKQLFERHNNRIGLTDAGRVVYDGAARGLDRIAAMTGRVLDDDMRPQLVVSVLPSLAHRWLPQRIGDLIAANDQIRIDLRVEEDPVDFVRHTIDLRICYGEHLYPDLRVTPLIRDQVVPLCSPGFLDAHAAIADNPQAVRDDALIHTNWGASFASHPAWSDWFEKAGIARRPDISKGHRAVLSSLAIDLAARGAGICLGQKMLARDDLEAGRLVQPFTGSIELGHAYCAVHSHIKADKPEVREIMDVLMRSAGSD